MPEVHAHYEPESRGPDPSRKLQQLTGELKRKQAEIDTLNKQTTDLQTDINDLKATVAEVTQIISGYGENVTKLRKDREDLEYFLEQKTKMVGAAVHDKKEAIDRIIRDYDAGLNEHANKVSRLAERAEEAHEEYDKAAATAQERQHEYDVAKNAQQTITARLTELKTLREQIVAADDKTDVATMYFLALEMRHVMNHTHVVSQGELAEKLNEALAALEEAKEHARARKNSWDALKLEHDAEKNKLDDMKTNRRKNILAAIQAAWPPPPAQAQASTTT